jgi:hypothetical protein
MNSLDTADVEWHLEIEFGERVPGKSPGDGAVVQPEETLAAEATYADAVPGVEAHDIRGADVGDAAPKVEAELEPALDEVQAYEVAPAVRQLAVVDEEAVARPGQEPELDGEGAGDALEAGQLQVAVARHLRYEELGELRVHWEIHSKFFPSFPFFH